MKIFNKFQKFKIIMINYFKFKKQEILKKKNIVKMKIIKNDKLICNYINNRRICQLIY